MEVRARLQNFRVSPHKARLVVDEIRGKGVDDALTILDFSTKGFAKPLAKLVRSALANAEDRNNVKKAGIDLDNLVVERIHVDQGASNWRIRARAQGRAAWINHRTSNISVTLAER